MGSKTNSDKVNRSKSAEASSNPEKLDFREMQHMDTSNMSREEYVRTFEPYVHERIKNMEQFGEATLDYIEGQPDLNECFSALALSGLLLMNARLEKRMLYCENIDTQLRLWKVEKLMTKFIQDVFGKGTQRPEKKDGH